MKITDQACDCSGFDSSRESPVVWGVVICFHPDHELLVQLVARLSPQVATVLVLNNGGMSQTLRSEISCFENLAIYDFGENRGIAAALNEGFSRAAAADVSFVVTFDQDSCPEQDHVARLVNHWLDFSLQKDGLRKMGAIGPSFYDARNTHFEYPFYRASGLKVIKNYASCGQTVVEADALITSGMLVPTEIWRNGCRFDENLFIDFVDTEWCFRTGSLGYVHYGCFDVIMKHELSEASPFKFLGLMVLKYSPIRRYYHFRNCFYLVSRTYVPLAFRIRLVGGLILRFFTLPLVDDKPASSIKSIAAGVLDFMRGKYGRRHD